MDTYKMSAVLLEKEGIVLSCIYLYEHLLHVLLHFLLYPICFLFCYVRDFMTSLSNDDQADII